MAETKLKDLIVKKGKDGKNELTTGAKIGGAVAVGGLALLLSKIKGKKSKPTAPTPTGITVGEMDVPRETGSTPNKPKSNTMLYVGLGVGAVLIVGAVLFITKKKP